MPKNKRWHEAGWKTYPEAYKTFRGLVQNALDAGVHPGQPLPLNAVWQEAMLWLIAGHPHAEYKTQGGVRYFTLHKNEKHSRGVDGYGFSVVDGFGVEHRFSLKVALRGEEISPKVRATDAFRREVWEDTARAKRRALGALCPETGVVLREDNCETDHAETDFVVLLESFLAAEKLTLDQIQLVASVKHPSRRDLSDRELAARWRAFHMTYAKLEVVSAEGHKMRTQRRRSNPFGGLRS
jgi:hypothetical protein